MEEAKGMHEFVLYRAWYETVIDEGNSLLTPQSTDSGGIASIIRSDEDVILVMRLLWQKSYAWTMVKFLENRSDLQTSTWEVVAWDYIWDFGIWPTPISERDVNTSFIIRPGGRVV